MRINIQKVPIEKNGMIKKMKYLIMKAPLCDNVGNYFFDFFVLRVQKVCTFTGIEIYRFISNT